MFYLYSTYTLIRAEIPTLNEAISIGNGIANQYANLYITTLQPDGEMKTVHTIVDSPHSPTILKIKEHADLLMRRGSPFTKDELEIIKMATPSGKAFNAGKRKRAKMDK